jgi:hypothetical protein
MVETIVLFLDTNVFLHYQSFDQIDWSALFGVANVEIIIPPVTVHELNKHKDSHPKPRIRARAADIIKKLLGLFENSLNIPISQDLIIHLEDREPQVDFSQHQLSREVKDDELIASVLFFKNEKPEKRVILVTSDFGLILMGKAKRQGVEVYRLPDSYKLPEEPDPNEKKVLELQAELRKIKNTRPEVLLVFGNGENHIHFPLEHPKPTLTSIEIEKLLAKEKNEHPLMQNVQSILKAKGLDTSAMAALTTMYSITSADTDAYNNELEKYYAQCKKFFQKQVDYENLLARTLELDLWVLNRGTAPAEDIDIFMHFPDGFTLFSEEKFPKAPQSPEPPSEPRTAIEKMNFDSTRLGAIMSSLSRQSFNQPEPPSNVSGFDIQRTNSYDVHFHVERLKHKLREAADTIYITFANYEDAKSFEVDFRILVANLAEPTEGKLHVIVDKSN